MRRKVAGLHGDLDNSIVQPALSATPSAVRRCGMPRHHLRPSRQWNMPHQMHPEAADQSIRTWLICDKGSAGRRASMVDAQRGMWIFYSAVLTDKVMHMFIRPQWLQSNVVSSEKAILWAYWQSPTFAFPFNVKARSATLQSSGPISLLHGQNPQRCSDVALYQIV